MANLDRAREVNKNLQQLEESLVNLFNLAYYNEDELIRLDGLLHHGRYMLTNGPRSLLDSSPLISCSHADDNDKTEEDMEKLEKLETTESLEKVKQSREDTETPPPPPYGAQNGESPLKAADISASQPTASDSSTSKPSASELSLKPTAPVFTPNTSWADETEAEDAVRRLQAKDPQPTLDVKTNADVSAPPLEAPNRSIGHSSSNASPGLTSEKYDEGWEALAADPTRLLKLPGLIFEAPYSTEKKVRQLAAHRGDKIEIIKRVDKMFQALNWRSKEKGLISVDFVPVEYAYIGSCLVASQRSPNKPNLIAISPGDIIRLNKYRGDHFVAQNLRTKSFGQVQRSIIRTARPLPEISTDAPLQPTVSVAAPALSPRLLEIEKFEETAAAEWERESDCDTASFVTYPMPGDSTPPVSEEAESPPSSQEPSSRSSSPRKETELSNSTSASEDDRFGKITLTRAELEQMLQQTVEQKFAELMSRGELHSHTSDDNWSIIPAKQTPLTKSESDDARKAPCKPLNPLPNAMGRIQETCKNWASTRGCRYTDEECNRIHASIDTPPLDYGSKDAKSLTCYFWAITGVCKLDDSKCMYSHWDTGKVAPPPRGKKKATW